MFLTKYCSRTILEVVVVVVIILHLSVNSLYQWKQYERHKSQRFMLPANIWHTVYDMLNYVN